MTSVRKIMPIGDKLENLRGGSSEGNRKSTIRYNSSTHKLLLYAKFKKRAFPWDDWNNFHADNYNFRKNSGECFYHLVVGGYLYHRVIDGIDWFQITPDGELKLITISEKDQKRRSRLSSESSAKGRMTYLAQNGKI